MNKKILRYMSIIIIFFLLVYTLPSAITTPNSSQIKNSNYITTEQEILDIQYIYNLTEALSNIIFTEYDIEGGELAKGRAYGTKGEHKAAEIIAENMTKIGLYTTIEQLTSRPQIPEDDITHKLEVLDYKAEINDQQIECYIAPSWKGPRDNKDELDQILDYENLKIIPIPRFPCIYNPSIAKEDQDFVFIDKDLWNHPDEGLPFVDLFKPVLHPLKHYMVFHITSLLNIQLQTASWYRMYPHCKGLIKYDFNQDCYDMIYFPKNGNSLPVLFINGSTGDKIIEKPEDYILDFTLSQRYNDSIISYNVIGQINGSSSTKTVILSCLYDCWWNQGTADSAIGMAMVLAVAKYFKENNLEPYYNLKFIAFSGEEYDLLGAYHYEATHQDEEIIAVIDLNQLGFTQNEPRLTLDIVANKKPFLEELWNVAQKSNYVERTGDVTDIEPIWWPSNSIPGNAAAFAYNRRTCNAVSFFKDGGWILHHRDGMEHTEGDVLKYFNWTDTAITGEIILNITKHFTVDHPEWFNNPQLPIFNHELDFIDFQRNQ